MPTRNSFLLYVREKFYNEIFNGIDAYVKENVSELNLTSSRIYEVDEVDLDDIHIQHVNIDDGEGMRIDFFPIVNATVAFSGRGRFDVMDDSRNFLFRLHCTGDLSKRLEDFQITNIEEYSSRRQMNRALSDSLVPYIKSERLEEYAERILSTYYPEALQDCMPVDAELLARRMGLKVHRAKLTNDGSIFGQIYFNRCLAEIIDPGTGKVKKGFINANTVVVDTDALGMRSIRNEKIVISHECVHFVLHIKAFLFEQLFNEQLTRIQCQVTGDMVGGQRDSETGWMEWQANAIAPLLVMPKRAFQNKAQQLITELEGKSEHSELIDIIEPLIDGLAAYFGVTRAAAKARLIDLGVEEAAGAYIYMDGRYVKPHTTSGQATILKEKTFSVPAEYAGSAIVANPELYDAVRHGDYQYVDSHLVLNTPKYLQRDGKGRLELTRYARTHIEECCLAFDVDFEQEGAVWHEYRSFCVLNRDINAPYALKYTYAGGMNYSSADRQREYLDKIFNEENKVAQDMPMEFTAALKYLKKWRKTTNAEIAAAIEMDEKTVERLMHGTTKKFETLVLVCFALHLPPIISEPLIERAGYKLTISDRDLRLKRILFAQYGEDVGVVKEELKRNGILSEE